MKDDPVLIRREGSITFLTLNRPENGNAIDLPLARALVAAADECEADGRTRVVVLSGTGRMFCVGGDVSEFAAAGDPATFLDDAATTIHRAMKTFARMAKPLITAVHGPAAGAGFGLAIAGDLVIAGRSAHFTAGYGAIGLSPDGGLSWLLPRLVGLRRAQEIILTNRRIGSAEAGELGIVSRVVDDAALADEVSALAQRLECAPTLAIAATRALLAESYGTSLAVQLDREASAIAACGGRRDGHEGIAAFVAKRTPSFKGA